MSRLKILMSVFLLSSGIAVAASKDTGSWNNLSQLRAGDKIEVIDQSLRSYRGTFVSVSEEAISLRSKKDSFTVERSNVLRVSVLDKSKRLRYMLLGAAVGAGAALAVTVPLDLQYVGEGNTGVGIVAGVTAGAAGAGLGVGSTMGNRTIYRAAKTEDSGSP